MLNTLRQAIAAQEDVIAAAKEFKRSLMHRLFTNGPGREPAETKETEIGEIPAHWEVTDIGAVYEVMQYGTSQRCDYTSSGHPVLRIPNVMQGGITAEDLKYAQLAEDAFSSLRLVPGDLLFVRTNGLRLNAGRCAVYLGMPADAAFASYLIRVRFRPGTVAPQLVEAYAATPIGRAFLSGRAVETADGKFNINTDTIRNVAIPLPPPQEQRSIVDASNVLDAKIAAEEDRKTALEALFKSMLHQLMTGQVRLLSDEGLPLDRLTA